VSDTAQADAGEALEQERLDAEQMAGVERQTASIDDATPEPSFEPRNEPVFEHREIQPSPPAPMPFPPRDGTAFRMAPAQAPPFPFDLQRPVPIATPPAVTAVGALVER
jgi:hypothetical protein